MRILFLNYEYPPLGGGAANATAYLMREYTKIPDLEIDLVTSAVGRNFERENIGRTIKIHKLPIGKNPENLHYQSQRDLLAYSWKAYFYSRKLAVGCHYDLGHAFFSVPCGYLSYRYKKIFNLPYVVSLRGADVPGYTDRFSFLYKIISPTIRKIWKESSAVVSNSEGLKDLALETNPNQKIEVIPNGVDTDQFQPRLNHGSEASAVEASLPKMFKILCVSRLTERKGINYLVDALKLLSRKHLPVTLKIVGEGDAKADLEQQSKKLGLERMTVFSGLIAHEKLPKIYQEADVFVLPSLNEGMSNTMLEALSSGLPIVATDTGGTKELLADGQNGFIVKMKDSWDLAQKIERLINDRELRREMAIASRKIAEELSWENVAKKYYALYQKIIAENKPG